MTDYTNARFWAISGIGYGKGHSVAEAVKNHDEIQARNYRDMLNVPVAEVPLVVWEREADGFVNDGRIRWQVGDEYVEADGAREIRAGREQRDHWWEWVAEEGLDVEAL